MKWKKIKRRTRFALIFLICFSFIYGSYSFVNKYSEEIKDFLPDFLTGDISNVEAIELENITEIIIINRTKDLIFETNLDGTIHTRTRNSINIPIGFAITGKVNGNDYIISIEDYNWTWEQIDYNITRRRVNETRLNEAIRRNPNLDITEDLIDNVTFVITNLTGTNNNNQLVWEQQWIYDEEKNPKLRHSITNNLGKDITNITYWFVFKLPEDFNIKYNGIKYDTTKTKDTQIKNDRNLNLTRVLPIIDLGEIEFRYVDLLKSNFTITDFYIGNGSIIGHPETLIGAIGVSKGNSILANGETIILDPEVTDFKSPTRTGIAYDQWLNGVNVKTSNDVYAQTNLNNKYLSTDIYGFDSIPSDADIIGIEIKLEAVVTDNCGI